MKAIIRTSAVSGKRRVKARFDQTSTHDFRPAPTLEEHTDEILSELGLSKEDIAAQRSNRVIA